MSQRTVLAASSTLIAAVSLTSTGCFGALTAGPDIGPLGDSSAGQPLLPEEGRKTSSGTTSDTSGRRSWDRSSPAARRSPSIRPATTKSCGPGKKPTRSRAACPSCTKSSATTSASSKTRSPTTSIRPASCRCIGPVQLHHAHYKCTIYYTEITRVGWPVPHTLVDEDSQEVIYIDHNHFHMVGPVNTGPGANF